MSLRAKADGNAREIIADMATIPGCEVENTGHVGRGFPDAVASFGGRILFFEIKKPDGRRPWARMEKRADRSWLLTEPEKKFRERFADHYYIVFNREEARMALTRPPEEVAHLR